MKVLSDEYSKYQLIHTSRVLLNVYTHLHTLGKYLVQNINWLLLRKLQEHVIFIYSHII